MTVSRCILLSLTTSSGQSCFFPSRKSTITPKFLIFPFLTMCEVKRMRQMGLCDQVTCHKKHICQCNPSSCFSQQHRWTWAQQKALRVNEGDGSGVSWAAQKSMLHNRDTTAGLWFSHPLAYSMFTLCSIYGLWKDSRPLQPTWRWPIFRVLTIFRILVRHGWPECLQY